MTEQDSLQMDEFFDLHRQELEGFVPRTSLFSDYVAYCNEQGYPHHLNMVQFFRVVETMDTSVYH